MIHRFLHKKNIYLKIFLTLSIIHCQLLIATAQSPVRSQTILKPPYSTSLSDYYTNSDERLRLRLTNMDIKQPVIRARLQLHIISNKVTLRNRPFVGPIIELEAGVPNFLSGMDLAVYFNPANIEILSGLDYNALFQKPRLPDGTYTFRFDVIDANTGQLLSDIYYPQPSINIISNDPPFLNLPRKGDNIRYTDPLNIVFNWTPRAVIKGTTDYQFSLYEINDNGMPPENVPFMSQPIYQTTISTTTFLYGATEPPLLPGKKYAWRIQALAKQGIDSYSLYNNDGYTETFWFQLQDNCDPPQQISAVVKGGAVTLEWLNNPAMFKYIVEYRKKGNDFNRWFNTETNNTKVIITDVAVGNSYEYRVGGICTVGAGATYSDIRAFTIPPRDTSRNKTCGILPNINITNKNKLEILPIGANVMVGDYPATILSVTPNGGGSFSGTAAVRMNIFNMAETPVKAKFDNVAFNTDYKLIEGFMVTTYDKDEKQIFDADKVFEGGNDVGSVKTGLDATDISTNFPINKPEDIRVTLNTDGTAVIDITGANGQTQKIPVEKLPITIKDSEGTIYSVDKHGKVTKVGKAGAFKTVDFTKLNTIATDKAVVTFVAHDGQKYAFDQWKEVYNKSQLYKEKYEYLNGYRVSSKAIEAGKTDLVQARINISDKSIKPDSVRFVTGKGTQYESKYLGNNEYEITVVGGAAKDAQELYAIYATDNNNYLSFGKLLISSYPHQKQKLVLVPVNGASINKQEISKQLNTIYNKIAVEFDVQQDANFSDKSWDINKDGALQVDGSGLFSTLTDEMKALNNAYRSKRSLDKSTIYLFVLPKSSTAGIVGDMPRAKQFGYLFSSPNGGVEGATVAHEVGHGLFHLKHSFDSQYGFGKGELMGNVMDYPNGDQFSKLQWDAIHDPGLVIGVFEGDDDAMSFVEGLKKSVVYQLDREMNFVTPSGKIITLPKGAYVNTYCVEHSSTQTNGRLLGFKINDVEYVALNGEIYNPMGDFTGYYKIKNGSYTKEVYTNPNVSLSINSKQNISFIHEEKLNNGKKLLKLITEGQTIAKNNIESQGGTFAGKRSNDDFSYNPTVTVAAGDMKEFTSGCEDKNGSSNNNTGNNTKGKSLKDLVANAGKGNRTNVPDYNNGNSGVFDYANTIDAAEMQKMLKSLGTTESTNGVKGKVFITDYLTPESTKNAIRERLKNVQGKEIDIWMDVKEDKTYNTEVGVGNGLEGYNSKETGELIEKIKEKQGLFNIDPDWVLYGNPLTAFLDALAGLIGKLRIHERYYNPDHAEYNSLPAKIYSIVSLSIVVDKINELGSNDISDKYTSSRKQFAFVCGVVNGAVDVVKGLPEGASLLVKLITDEDDTRTKLTNALSKISFSDIKKLAADKLKECGKNPCMVSYCGSYTIFQVVTIALPFTKVGQVGNISKTLAVIDRLDVVGQSFGLLFKACGKVIKPILSVTGKGIRFTAEVGWEFIRPIKNRASDVLYSFIIPIPKLHLTERLERAYVKAKELFEAGTLKETDIIYPKDEGGNFITDEYGNKIGEVEVAVDGSTEKVTVIQNDDASKLEQGVSSSKVTGTKNFITLIDDKVKIVEKEILYGNQAETFLNSEYATAELLEDVLTYRRFGGNAKLGGSYVSTADKLTREELALVEEFNNSMRFEAIIKVPKGEKINIGKVGPWPPKAPEYMGGADQVILKYNYPENAWVQSIKDFKTGKIYTYGEFKTAFPNLCR